jgi:hypothetical protein
MHMNRRLFDWSTHEQFARLSADLNPIHVDATAARRTHSGAPIVHGIHSLIWAMDRLVQSKPAAAEARTLKVQFPRPIFVGDEVVFEILEASARLFRIRLLVADEEVLLASLGLDESPRVQLPMQAAHAECKAPPESPQDLRLQAMEGLSGCLSFAPAYAQIGSLFPAAAKGFGLQRIAALVCTSCLVGMVVPGLHSLFSGLEIALCEDNSEPADAIRFTVTSIVTRFRLVRIGISARGVRGSLETVSRLPPVRQAGFDRLLGCVGRDEFKNSTSLIIGGSRGLGELTTKLLAAGGGNTVISYTMGKADADAVVEEVAGVQLKCRSMPYDVRRAAAEQLTGLDVIPTHLYYFATPAIFRRKSGLFDIARFNEFNTFYVSGFFDLVQACLRLRPGGIKVFYPSSSALDARPANMTEYSMSKAAGEVLCADLTRFVPGVQVLTRRLPRLPTDQTSSVVPAKTADPIDVMLSIVREMNQ